MPKTLPSLLGLLLVGGSSMAAQDGSQAPFYSLAPGVADAPGCAVGVRHNGVVVHQEGFGLADLEHRAGITPSSVFYTGSLSKQVTAMAVAMLAQDGVIDLDAPAAKWIPEMTGPLASITIRQMVHHTSGLREKWDLLAMQGVPTDRTVITQQMVLDLVAKQRELSFTPGSRHLYNNTAYDLLATLVGRASGMSFRDFVQQRIFAPRGMTRSLFADRWGEVIPNRVMGYARQDSQWVRTPALVETVGSGSLHSTLDDMLKWVAWFDDAPASDSALINLLEMPGTLTTGEPTTYGFGLVIDSLDGYRRVQHTGSLAGYRTAVWRIPGMRWSGVALCNDAAARPGFNLWESLQRSLGRPWSDPIGSVGSISTGPTGMMVGNAIPDDLPGEYVSPELGITWVITRAPEYTRIRGPGIVNEQVRLSSTAMRVDYRWEVRVERDTSGTIVALLMDTGRSLGIRFVRVPK
jgi:CubicO group peptidase (beta-lactamase class C family)